jgi:hypothetical protein
MASGRSATEKVTAGALNQPETVLAAVIVSLVIRLLAQQKHVITGIRILHMGRLMVIDVLPLLAPDGILIVMHAGCGVQEKAASVISTVSERFALVAATAGAISHQETALVVVTAFLVIRHLA